MPTTPSLLVVFLLTSLLHAHATNLTTLSSSPSTSSPSQTIASATPTVPTNCPRNSASACPTPSDPCCRFLCAEAQVPFLVCSPENQTFLASCDVCPSTTSTSTYNTASGPVLSASETEVGSAIGGSVTATATAGEGEDDGEGGADTDDGGEEDEEGEGEGVGAYPWGW